MAFQGRRWSSADVNADRKQESLRRSSFSAAGSKRLPIQFANIDWKNDDSETGFDDEEQDSDISSLSEESFRAGSDSDGSSSATAGNDPENAKVQKLKVRSDSKSRCGSKETFTRIRRASTSQIVPAGLVRFRKGVRKAMMAMRFQRKEPDAHGVCLKDVSTRAKQRYSVLFNTITDQRERDFMQELLRSLPILLNETSWLVEVFRACNDFEGRAPVRHVCNLIAKSMHGLKMLTARYCWARNVEPIREELTKLSEKHEELKRQFNTARSSYLLEVSSLRNKVQTRADVSEVLGKSDGKGNVAMFCPSTVLHEEERTFFMKAVEEKLKMLVEVGKDGNLAANISEINAFNEAQREDDQRKSNKEIAENRQKIAKLEKRCYTLEKEADAGSSNATNDKTVKLLEMHVGKLKQQLKETTLEGENALAASQADIATQIVTIEAMRGDIATQIVTIEAMRGEITEMKKAMLNRNAAEIVVTDMDAESVKQDIVDIACSGSKKAYGEASATEPKEEPRMVFSCQETYEQNQKNRQSGLERLRCVSRAPSANEAAMEFEELSNCSGFQHVVPDGIERSDLSKQNLGTLRNAAKDVCDNVANAVSQDVLNCTETSPEKRDVENPDFALGAITESLSVHPEEVLQLGPVSKKVADKKAKSDRQCFQPLFKLSAEHANQAEHARPPLAIITACQPPQKDAIEISDVIGPADGALFPEFPEAWPSLPAGAKQNMPFLRRAQRRVPPRSTTDPTSSMADFAAIPLLSISNLGNSNKGSFRNQMSEISSNRFRTMASGRGMPSIAIPVQRRRSASPHVDPETVASEFNLSRSGKFRRSVPAADQRSLSDTDLGSMRMACCIARNKKTNEEMKFRPLPALREMIG